MRYTVKKFRFFEVYLVVEANEAKLLGCQNLFKFCNKDWQIKFYGVPKYIKVDLIITVDEAVTHPYYLGPRY